MTFPVSNIMDKFCESFPARQTNTCDLIRKIWVDRTDFYRCDKRASDFIKVCEKQIQYNCRKNNGLKPCVRNNIRVSGAQSWWSGTNLIVNMPAPTRINVAAGTSILRLRSFDLEIADHLKFSTARLVNVRSKGAVQVRLPSGVVGTWAQNILPVFGRNTYNQCPANDRDGKLLPVTKLPFYNPYRCGQFNRPRSAVAVIANGPMNRDNATRSTRNPTWDMGGGVSPFNREPGWIEKDDQGNADAAIRYICHSYPQQDCHDFADVTHRPDVNRNTNRFLTLNQYTAVKPGGKRFRKTRVNVRVVHDSRHTNGGWVRLTFKFDDPNCCDRFQPQEVQTCK